MTTIRWAAAWLLIAGVIYLRSMSEVMSLVISGRMTALRYAETFAGPVLFIVASCFLLAGRFCRVATVVVFFACAWLTWTVGENYWPSAVAPVQYDWLFIFSAFVLLLSYAAIFVIWRRLGHLTMRSSEPPTGDKIST
jgi:small-conductance mechanosensitive channel